MLTFPAERTQTDGEQDLYSLAAGLDLSEEKVITRQEYKDDADINKLLAKYGVGIPQRLPGYGEADFNIDLQQAFNAIQTAQRVWAEMPADLKDKYPSWQHLLNNIRSGELEIDLEQNKPIVPPKPEVTG